MTIQLKHMLLWLVIVLALLLAGCGGGSSEEAAPSGSASQGEQLFNQTTIGTNNAPGCVTCHSLQAGQTLVGPSLATVATDAAEIIQSSDYTGQATTVAGYLRESIVSPNAYVVQDFSAGQMYQDYEEALTAGQIDDLVAFLMTLK
jgi:mono/diheme cytochrome c family protein